MNKYEKILRDSPRFSFEITLGELTKVAYDTIEEETGVTVKEGLEITLDSLTKKVGIHLNGDKFTEKEVNNLGNYNTMEDFLNAELVMHDYFKELGSDVNKVAIYNSELSYESNSICTVTIEK